MVLSRLSKACGALTLALALSVGCGDSGSDDTGSTAGNDGGAPVGDASMAAVGDKAAGQSKAQACAACHGTDYAGQAPIGAPNITPDLATGIGEWTTQQIVDALLKNIDDEGAPLCAQMASTKTLSATDANNIAAYLKSLPAVSKDIPDICK